MFFQEITPDTSGYMIAGYAIAFIVMALYVASIYVRTRNLNQDMTMLEEMDKPATPIVEKSTRPNQKKSAGTVTKRAGKK
jgi:hypothetical protein